MDAVAVLWGEVGEEMSDREIASGRITPLIVFTVAVVLAFALYGAASAGRDIMSLYLWLP